jgi:hypothetical protein
MAFKEERRFIWGKLCEREKNLKTGRKIQTKADKLLMILCTDN